MGDTNPVGRPPIFDLPEKLQAKIDEYFESGVKKRTVIIGKEPNKIAVELPVPTITGLVLFAGFESRQSFYEYENKPEFSYTIKKARTRIENVYEENLQLQGDAGSIFALKNMGWKDKQELEHSGLEKPPAELRVRLVDNATDKG